MFNFSQGISRFLRGILFFFVVWLIWQALFVKSVNKQLETTNPYRMTSKQISVIEDWKKSAPNEKAEQLKFCQLVGTWISTRDDNKFQIQLHDDATFTYIQIAPSDKLDIKGDGKWRFAEGSLIWEYRGGQFDNNPVFKLDLDRGKLYQFHLVENNGDITHFERDLKQSDTRDGCKS